MAAGGTDRNGTFRCTPERRDGAICLRVAGELDLASVDTFRAHLRMAADGSHAILLDFGGLRYLDSTGINALLVAQKSLSLTGGRIALTGVSPSVRRILSVLNLETVIPVFATQEEALAHLTKSGE
jgi:anti-anti-sigma factor